MELSVRRATRDDAHAIAEIHVHAWKVAYRGLVPDGVLDALSVPQREQFWREAAGGGQGAGAVLVAFRDGEAVGFCALATPTRDEDADDGTAGIGAIYVDPGAWRRGVGSALMEAALAELRAGCWRSVTLWVLAENRQARTFYARFGFEPDGAEMGHERGGQIEVRLRLSVCRGEGHRPAGTVAPTCPTRS